MPKNLNLQPIPSPLTNRRNTLPKVKPIVAESALKVKLLHSPTIESLKSYLPNFVTATWCDDCYNQELTEKQKYEQLAMVFQRKTLPTALETIRFEFLISGMSTQDVTHLIRTRTFSFSARCTGDRDLRNDDTVIPEAIANNKEFNERYNKLVQDSLQLYADMVDSELVSIMDARLALLKAHTNEYYVSCNIKDLIGFLNQRKDEQIQPSIDNLMALYMYEEICKALPIACFNLVKFNVPDMFYVHTAQTYHSTRLYAPEKHNDIFEWHPESFIYKDKQRRDVSGSEDKKLVIYDKIKEEVLNNIELLKHASKNFWLENGIEI